MLSLLASPLSAPILRAHLEGPLRLPALRDRIGAAAQTTLRGQVGNLRNVGALERQARTGMPYTVENGLTDAGRGILEVADLVEVWLSRAPHGQIALGSEAAKGAIRALGAGWGSTMLRALALRPLSLTALDGALPDLSYPSLERRLSAMRVARLVQALPGDATGAKPYTVTDWARQAAGVLVAAGKWESEYLSDRTEPLPKIDVEGALLLAIPLVELPDALTGPCLLAISENEKANPAGFAGIAVRIDHGEVLSCTPSSESGNEPQATGAVESWVAAVLEGEFDGITYEGPEAELARVVVESMHLALT